MTSSVQATFFQSKTAGPNGSGSEGKASGQGLLSEAAQQRRPIYTTAGTLWNPESAKPIRAPVRRGRASIGSFGAPGGDTWGFLPQHGGGSLFHLSQAPPIVPHYAPLQQNNDRARSPSPSPPIQGGKPVSTDMGSIGTRVGCLPIETEGTAMTPRGSQSDMASVKLEEEDSDETPDDDAFVRKLPMKTLVNLASYKNPFQQKAQNVLRVKSNPVGAPTTPDSEAAAQNANQHHQQLAAAPSFVPVQPTQMSARPVLDSSAVPPKIPTGTQPPHPRQPSLFPSSTLATGPGAPEPLRAGPPGQRQQGPSKIERALAANSNDAGMRNSAQPLPGTHSIQPYRQYPALSVSKEAGGISMTGHPRPISVRYCGQDGARSSKEHAEAMSDVGAAISNFDSSSHIDICGATRASTGERSATESSSRVPTPRGFNKQDHGRGPGSSSPSARCGTGGVSVHQPSSYNAMPGGSTHTALLNVDQRSGLSDEALFAQQPKSVDPSCQNMAIAMDTRGAQFVVVNPSQISSGSGEFFTRCWGNENLGSNIRQLDSTNVPCGDTAIVPVAAQAPVSIHTTSAPRGAEYWSEGVGNLAPYVWDPAEYHMPSFGQYPHGAVKVNDQMLREGEAKINAWFYSNTSRLGKTIDDVLEERKHPKARSSPFGAIGDGRPVPGSGLKKTYSQISIDEANEMPASEHAGPLLNLAFQALLNFKDTEETRECLMKNERKVKAGDGECEERLEKLGSAALLSGSFSDGG